MRERSRQLARGLAVALLALALGAPGVVTAAEGWSSAGARTLWTLGATQTGTGLAQQRGLWLDIDSGARESASGLTLGGRAGWVMQEGVEGAVALGGRVGYARSVWAWSGFGGGELILGADIWVGLGANPWWSDGPRFAPRFGLRALVGYGLPIRARLRVDVAPALFSPHDQGLQMGALWLRAGVDIGVLTVGCWATAWRGERQQGGSWRQVRDLGLGLAIGLRSGRPR